MQEISRRARCARRVPVDQAEIGGVRGPAGYRDARQRGVRLDGPGQEPEPGEPQLHRRARAGRKIVWTSGASTPFMPAICIS